MARQKESNFSDKVARYLDGLPNTWHFRYSGNLAGLPDRMACINGRFIALEIKASVKAKKSKLQNHIIKKIAAAGGSAWFCSPENWVEIKESLWALSISE